MDSASSDMSVEDAAVVQQDLLQPGPPAVDGIGVEESASSPQPATIEHTGETVADDITTAPSLLTEELTPQNLVDSDLLKAVQPATETSIAFPGAIPMKQ